MISTGDHNGWLGAMEGKEACWCACTDACTSSIRWPGEQIEIKAGSVMGKETILLPPAASAMQVGCLVNTKVTATSGTSTVEGSKSAGRTFNGLFLLISARPTSSRTTTGIVFSFLYCRALANAFWIPSEVELWDPWKANGYTWGSPEQFWFLVLSSNVGLHYLEWERLSAADAAWLVHNKQRDAIQYRFVWRSTLWVSEFSLFLEGCPYC